MTLAISFSPNRMRNRIFISLLYQIHYTYNFHMLLICERPPHQNAADMNSRFENKIIFTRRELKRRAPDEEIEKIPTTNPLRNCHFRVSVSVSIPFSALCGANVAANRDPENGNKLRGQLFHHHIICPSNRRNLLNAHDDDMISTHRHRRPPAHRRVNKRTRTHNNTRGHSLPHTARHTDTTTTATLSRKHASARAWLSAPCPVK